MLSDSLKTAFLHYKHALNHYDSLKKITIDSNNFRDKNIVVVVDAFIFRFLKLQDFMGDKLFKDLLTIIGLYKSNMSLLDVLDKLEKIELLHSANQWMDFRKIRNQLTHDYPDNTQDVIDGIHIALKIFKEIEIILFNFDKYIKNKKLIEK